MTRVAMRLYPYPGSATRGRRVAPLPQTVGAGVSQPAPVAHLMSAAHPVSAAVSDVSAETLDTLRMLETLGTCESLDTPRSRIRRARSTRWQSIHTPSS